MEDNFTIFTNMSNTIITPFVDLDMLSLLLFIIFDLV